MNVHHFYKWCVVAALAALGANLGSYNTIVAQPIQAGVDDGAQVLTRGPVHEAFAETVTFDPEPGVVITKVPPAAIEELPPDQRPEGASVAWIPGYWAWDDERTDFLWVSGIWRDLPPGRQWVPGYWGRSGQGFQWTAGYWADAKVTEVQYLTEPPATVESGPNIPAPSADATWLPGCWIWQNSRYAWRPGFWVTVQPDWSWVPAHYVYAPRGYVFVDGYWDYSVERRGVLFAPVYFGSGAYTRRGFSYSPTTVIDLGVFASHLFLRPQYQHYYFGDYYARSYQTAGYYPSYSYNTGRLGYDPFYAHQRWQHRQDNGWEQRQQADYRDRRDHEDLRPPRTWAAQKALGPRAGQAAGKSLVVASPLDDFRKNKNGPLRFQSVDQAERRQISQHAQEVQRFRETRRELETGAAGTPAKTHAKEVVPPRVRLPGSPIVAKPAAELARDRTPPKTYEAPKPDPRVEAKARMAREQSYQHTVKRLPPEQPRTQPQPQPKVERPAPQPERQPKVERPAPQPERQPKVERQPPQPRDKDAASPPEARSKQDTPRNKGKN